MREQFGRKTKCTQIQTINTRIRQIRHTISAKYPFEYSNVVDEHYRFRNNYLIKTQNFPKKYIGWFSFLYTFSLDAMKNNSYKMIEDKLKRNKFHVYKKNTEKKHII